MKKRNFFAGIMFLAAAATIRLALAQTGIQYAIVTDSSGAPVGILSGPDVSMTTLDDILNGLANTTPAPNQQVAVPVTPYTVDQLNAMGVPVTSLSSLAPAPTTTSTPVTVKVPYSAPVAFCAGGKFYNKATGLCADGKFPTKVVPLGSLKDPAAQNPTIVCRAPTVPTWNPAMKKWNCIVPTGFKNTLGE